jgi:osmoprotectant transport system substrate-binding protein
MRYDSKGAFRASVLVFGLVLAATACGDDNGDGGGGTSSEADLSGASFTVGSKEFTEQLILGQMTIQLLENAGADVKDETGITGTTNVRKALTSGQIDMYWDYTGTGWAELLGHEPTDAPSDDKALFDAVAKEDLQKNNIKWFALSSANDTYAIATSQDTSDSLGVTTLSDWADVANKNPDDASLCAASEFIDRSDGLPGVEKAYGFDLPGSALTEVDLGIIFTRVPKADPCKFGEVFATDGRIPANDMVVLDDDKNYFVKYDLALTIDDDVYKKYPELEKIFDPVAKALTTEELQKLNAQVDVQGLPADQVAKQWLEDKGFL